MEKIKEKAIVIIGSEGMLGHDLARVFPRAVKLTHRMIDITKKDDVFSKLSELRPDIVINAAAYTNVEAAEIEESAANLLNTDAVSYLARVCHNLNCVLLHYSTDYVFDGTKEEGYDEDDDAHPLNAYGRSKLGGELSVQKSLKCFYIIRTSWLFGRNGRNFVDTISKLAREKDEIKVVNDQFGSPTYTCDLAEMTRTLLGKECPYGIYHVTNSGSCSWFDFAREIVSLQEINCLVLPCSSVEYPSRLIRPRYSILNNNKVDGMPPWQDALRRYLLSRK